MTRARTVVLALAGLVIAGLLAVAANGQVWLHRQHSDDLSATQAQDGAVSAVTSTLSYDYRHLLADQSKARKQLTGDARSEYDKVQSTLTKTAPGLHAVVAAKVAAHSVLSVEGDRARVLLFVDQTSTSTQVTQPRLDQSRVVVTVQRRHGRWLVSSLQAE